MSLLCFWTLIVLITLLSMEDLRALGMHQKYLHLCSEDEWRSYEFGMAWGWVINDRIFIFWWTIPLMPSYYPVTLLKIKVLYWHQWFYEEHPWNLSNAEKVLLEFLKMFFKMVLLGTVHWKVLWGTKYGSFMASLQKPLFLRVCYYSKRTVK